MIRLTFAAAVLCLAIVSSSCGAIFKRNACSRSQPFGRNGGRFFTDANIERNGEITKIFLRAGRYVDGIQITHGTHAAPYHGGNGGYPHTINLDPDERITKIGVRSGRFIDQLLFTTNKRIYGPYGEGGGRYQEINMNKLDYISGRVGRFLDQIQFYFNC